MKIRSVILILSFLSPLSHAGDSLKYGAGISDMHKRVGFQTGGKAEQGDQIAGQCSTRTDGPIPVGVPCRDVELILKNSNGHQVATATVGPRGAFIFAQIPKGTYSMVIRSTAKTKFETSLQGLKPGYTYDVSLDPFESAGAH